MNLSMFYSAEIWFLWQSKAPSRLDAEGRTVLSVEQNQAELAQPAVMCFCRTCRYKQSDFRVIFFIMEEL